MPLAFWYPTRKGLSCPLKVATNMLIRSHAPALKRTERVQENRELCSGAPFGPTGLSKGLVSFNFKRKHQRKFPKSFCTCSRLSGLEILCSYRLKTRCWRRWRQVVFVRMLVLEESLNCCYTPTTKSLSSVLGARWCWKWGSWWWRRRKQVVSVMMLVRNCCQKYIRSMEYGFVQSQRHRQFIWYVK
jgi:hypothetical protein